MDIALLLGRSGRYSKEYAFCAMGESRESAARLATDQMNRLPFPSSPFPNNPFPPIFVQEIERTQKAFLSFDTKEWDGKGVTGVISMMREGVAPMNLIEAEGEDLDYKFLSGLYVLLGEPEEFEEVPLEDLMSIFISPDPPKPRKFWEERDKVRAMGTRELVEFCLGVTLEKNRRNLIGMKREAAERGIVSPMG